MQFLVSRRRPELDPDWRLLSRSALQSVHQDARAQDTHAVALGKVIHAA